MDDRELSNKERVTYAMRTLPRDQFIEMSDPSLVLGRSIPPTNAVSEILMHANIHPGHKVLQIGTGAGYVAALVSRLSAQVVTLEINPAIARSAQDRFNKLQLANLVLRRQDGSEGAPDLGPFDRILVSTPRVSSPGHLLEQLSTGGILIALEQGENDTHTLVRYEVSELGAPLRKVLAYVDFYRDSGMTLLDMGMVDQVMLSEARRSAREKKLPIIKVLRDRLNMDDPDSLVDDIFHMYSYEKLVKILITPNDFKRLWTTVELSLQGDSRQFRGETPDEIGKKEPEQVDLLSHEKTRVEAHLITLCDALLLDAVSEGASDLHIEQYRDRVRIRLRVDGDLHDITHYALSAKEARGLVNVIKIRGDMDIAEKRLPQGGRSQLTAGGVAYDLRIQIQPSLHGEAVVIRILPQSGNIVAIENLGMNSAVMRDYRRMLDNPSGLVLVVGPTGSGKSTTLYAGLSEIARDGSRKVLTIEDPIEYSIDNIQQTWTRPEIGFSFADGMRSFVRLDPDVILVGEIRDHETALEAIRASQTGHVVLSTLHSNDAIDALQRIYDLDVQANSVASELMAVIAQKLAKRICPECKIEAQPDPAILEELFPDGAPDSFRCYEGEGCEACNGRGTKGRVGVVEYMQVNNEIRSAISQLYPVTRLRAIALDSGLTTMRDSGLSHVINGIIPLSELRKVLPADRMAPEKRGAW